MHILFISQYFFPEQFSVNALAKALVARGHEVDVISCVPNYPAGEFFDGFSNSERREDTWEGVAVHRVRTIPRGRTKLKLIANYSWYPLAAWTRLRQLLRRKADVSFVSLTTPPSQAIPAIWARWRHGIPTVYWIQDVWPETVIYLFKIRNRLLIGLLDAICGWLYRRADIVMVQSEAMPPLIERHGVPPEKIRVLPNTAAPFYRAVAKDAHSKAATLVPKAPFVLMFAGSIGESQGLDLLVAAANRLRHRDDIAYSIVGSGRAERGLREAIEGYGLTSRFHFAGRHPEEDMPDFFVHADAMFLSLKDFPNFALTVPYKTQAYLACGKPIVASIRGEGARIITEAGAGLTCLPEDEEALALVIAEMADKGRSERAAMGRRARAYFEQHFSAEVVHGLLETTLAEVAAKGVKR